MLDKIDIFSTHEYLYSLGVKELPQRKQKKIFKIDSYRPLKKYNFFTIKKMCALSFNFQKVFKIN